MITQNEWNTLARMIFPRQSVNAPPFLWTRVLAGIEAEETRRASLWWMQWRWMSRVSFTVGLLVSLGTFYLFRSQALPLDSALEGRSSQHQAIQLASSGMDPADELAELVPGIDS